MIRCVIRHYMFGASGYIITEIGATIGEYGVIGYGKYVEIPIGEFDAIRYTKNGAIMCDT